MTKEQLKEIIENHQHWINEDCDGWQDMRADLSGVDLSRADMSGANMSGANMSRADMSGAYMSGVDMSGADMSGANMSRADMSGAYMSGANMSRADMSGANMSRADMSGAYMSGANMSRADMSEAKNVPFIPYACPDFGMFIGYKKAGGYIVELEIPENAKRVSATGRKCRCDKAKVLRILTKDREPAEVTEVRSNYDKNFVYKVGETVEVKDFNENRWDECSAGIHFFINFMEAVQYI